MATDAAMLVAGLALLIAGGDWVVKGALAMGRRLGISPLLAGVVIVGFGTSTPELVVSLQAAISGNPDIAIGNVVGSNIANILLILGVGCMIAAMPASNMAIRRDGFSMIGASILYVVLSWDGALGPVDGLLFLLGIVLYVIWAYRTERVLEPAAGALNSLEHTSNLPPTVHTATQNQEPDAAPLHLLKTLGLLIVGFVALITGANFFVSGAVNIAASLGIPEVIIGLTLVAVGTSLPEFAATIMAALRRQTDVAIGNIIGSNIFNILFILGVSSLIADLPVTPRIGAIDQWVMLAVAVVLVIMMMWGRVLTRMKGALLVLAYIAYVMTMIE